MVTSCASTVLHTNCLCESKVNYTADLAEMAARVDKEDG